MKPIPVYIINLKKRLDRKSHILNEFLGRNEFQLNIIEAIVHKTGAIGLWQSMMQVIIDAKQQNEPYIIICEDDHQFTTNYNKELLFNAISEAQQKNATILMGGVSWFSDALQISNSLFWLDKFTGTQFIVIFQNFYDKLLEAPFTQSDSADYKICALTDEKFLMYPLISIQKEFGYSDVTSKNDTQEGYVTQIFNDTIEKLGHLNTVASFYNLQQ